MKIERILTLMAVLFLLGTAAKAQIYPVTATVQINPPATTYLTDFTALGSNQLSVNLFLNDFNEPVYDVRLKISITGNGISLVTHPGYVPPLISLSPGANLFSGSDLANYLNTNNMLVSGISALALQEGGSGLPEGIYTFCVQVYDYLRPDKALSFNQCSAKLLRKNYPPNLVFPACGSTVPVFAGNQDILFQWQVNADFTIQTLYELSIVEVPPGMNPNDAMNGTATKILDSEPVMGTNFLYGPDQLPLEIGKKYAYRIKVLDLQGNTTFENNGLTPVCTFYYGVDADGIVPLVSPAFDERVSTVQQLTFRWNRPENAIPGQQVYYKLKAVLMLDGQDPEVALEFNPVWYEVTTPVIPGNAALVLPNYLFPLPPERHYAWEVKAYSDNSGTEQEIAVSEKRFFKSAPAVERFKAGNPDWNIITVITLTGHEDVANNQKKISGIGTMKIRENGEEVTLHFTDIIVGPLDDFWQLMSGSITEPLNNFLVHLDNSGNPAGDVDNMDNYGVANFHATHVIVEKDDLKLRGKLRWQFPHATGGGSPVVESVEDDVLYNRLKIIDYEIGVEAASFDLLDPYGFRIEYAASTNSASNFSVFNSILSLTLDGEVYTITEVKDMSGNRMSYKFTGADNPYYFTQTGMEADPNIKLVKNTQIQLDAAAAIFDLSEDQSPEKIADTAWKGIYFTNFNVHFPTTFDGSNQIVLAQAQAYNFEPLAGNSFYGWVDRFGVNMEVLKAFTGSTGPAAAFNTFEGNIREMKIKLEDNNVSGCHVKGFVLIPFLNPDEDFTYAVPFDNNGLQVSFLDDDLVNKEVVLRQSSRELRLELTVKQAVFKDNERLDLVIDLQWEALGIHLTNVTEFKIWGSREIGFRTPGGAKGLTNVVGKFDNQFEITIFGIAAGFFGDTYAVNFITHMVLGDEKMAIVDPTSAAAPTAQFYTDDKRIPKGKENDPAWVPTAKYVHNKYWGNYSEGAKKELKGGKIALFIPVYMSYPITPKSAGLGLLGAGVGAGAGAGIGALLAADTIHVASYGENEGVSVEGTGNEEEGAGIGAAAGAGVGAAAALKLAEANAIWVLKGGLLYKTDDPVWGNVFMGVATAEIKRPIRYGIATKMVIGSKDDVHYGLFELTYQANKSDFDKLGTVKEALGGSSMAKQTSGAMPPTTVPTKRIIFGNFNVVEIGGRVYWNMSHDVEKECGKDMKSLVQLGGVTPENIDPEKIWKFLTTCQKLKMIAESNNLSEFLCQWRELDPKAFQSSLRALPEPDWELMKREVPQIPAAIWNRLKHDSIQTFAHLELLFPNEWCPHIVNAMLKQIENYEERLCNLPSFPPNIPPDLCKMSKGNQRSLLKRIDKQSQAQKPTKPFVVEERHILTLAEWNTMVAGLIPPDTINWVYIFNSYPDKDWCKIIKELPGVCWGPECMWPLPNFFPIDWPDSLINIHAAPAVPNWINKISPSEITNYRVDNSIDFGMMLKVRAENTLVPAPGDPPLSPEAAAVLYSKDGMATMFKGVLEMNGGQGSFGQFLLRVDVGMGNAPHPPTIDGSFVKGKGCITYTEKTKTFIADFQAQAIAAIGPPPKPRKGLCGQGKIHFQASPGKVDLEIGNQKFPIFVVTCPAGWGGIGWFELHQKDPNSLKLGAGMGLVLAAFAQTDRYGNEVCTFYGYVNAYAAMVAIADVTVEPELELTRAGILVGIGVDIGVNFSGMLCPFGNINALHLYLGGELIATFPRNELAGSLGGEAVLFGVIRAAFSFPFKEKII